MTDSVLFIPTLIIAVVQFVKYLVPAIAGPVTIVLAGIVGGIIGGVDIHIGVANITIAQGILTGLSSAGVVAVAAKVNTGISSYQR